MHQGRLVQTVLLASLVREDGVVRPEPLETLERLAFQVQMEQLVRKAREEIQGSLALPDLLDLLDCRAHLDSLETEDVQVCYSR